MIMTPKGCGFVSTPPEQLLLFGKGKLNCPPIVVAKFCP